MSSMVQPREYPLFLAGKWQTSEARLPVVNPYRGETVGETFLATAEQLEEATQAAMAAFDVLRHMSTYERSDILRRLAQGLRERKEEVARILCLESGKPIRDATVEVERGVFNLEMAAEEAKRLYGEVIPLDLIPASRGRLGIARRYPIGPVIGIYPFNFPLNLALHKVAPALAVGNPIVLKPPSNAPLTMLTFAEIGQGAGVPEGALSILPMGRQVSDQMIADDRFKLLSFTGSAVGWSLKAQAGKKKVILELGGNAGVIVDGDADLDYAVERLVTGAFAYAGQICISVQRIYVHEDVYPVFETAFLERVARLKLGDPLDPTTDLGPMIDEAAAQRTEEWVAEAVAEGARVLSGGQARGQFFEPTVLVNARPESKVCSLEVFAPVVTLFPFRDFDEAVAAVNQGHYGLQAGVFTKNLAHAFYAFDELEVGGVIVNDIPTYRIDHMPYGGVKDSGLGREGHRYAMEEMTEIRLMAINRF